MDHQNIIVGVIVFILFLVCWMLSSSYYSMYDDMISGMWKADPDWAEQADIDGMLLFIGPSEGSGILSETRKGYLIMHADDQIIASKKIDVNISTGISILPKTTVTYSMHVTDLSEPEEEGMLEADHIPWTDIMPYDLEMELGVSSGKLILNGTDDEGESTQYAKLFKDPAATDLSREMKEME
jgi:hypothetical protein